MSCSNWGSDLCTGGDVEADSYSGSENLAVCDFDDEETYW
jgi:hypothetical protein